jgi:hypothetical protein
LSLLLIEQFLNPAVYLYIVANIVPKYTGIFLSYGKSLIFSSVSRFGEAIGCPKKAWTESLLPL